MLFDEFLLPTIERLPASTAVKKALDSEEVLLHIYENLDDLTRVFCKYAETKLNIHDLEGIREIGMMNLQQFIILSTDCAFLGPIQTITATEDEKDGPNTIISVGKDEITLKDVRQVFSASQHDTAMNDIELQFLEDDSHKETMVFAEYVEAIVRLGFLKYSFIGDNCRNHHFECIRLAVAKITATKQ